MMQNHIHLSMVPAGIARPDASALPIEADADAYFTAAPAQKTARPLRAFTALELMYGYYSPEA